MKKWVSDLLKTSMQLGRYKVIKESFSYFRDKVLSIFLDTDVQLWPLFGDPKKYFSELPTSKNNVEKRIPYKNKHLQQVLKH